MALDEKLKDHQSYHNSSWGGREYVYQISWQPIQ